MSKDAAKRSELKRKARHELRELLVIFLYLAFFFCALTTYNMLLLSEFHEQYWSYGFALINALVITKVIMIGEAAKVGARYEARPLLVSAVYKAFMFGLLVFAFHIVEEVIKGLLHGRDVATVFHEVPIHELLARTVIVFCTFLPLFAFMEFRRALGEEKFYNLLFRSEEGRR